MAGDLEKWGDGLHAQNPAATRETRLARAGWMPRTDVETFESTDVPLEKTWEVVEVCKTCGPFRTGGAGVFDGTPTLVVLGKGGMKVFKSPPITLSPPCLIGEGSGGVLLPPTQLVPPV